MSYGGYNPNTPSELPIARSRTGSISSVHSQSSQLQQQHPQQAQQSQSLPPQPPQQQQQYPSSPYGSPYSSQPGTPGITHPAAIGDGSYFSPGVSGHGGHGGGTGSGLSTPMSAPSSYCPTPPIPTQQHQHAGYMPTASPVVSAAAANGGSLGGPGDQSGYSSGYETPPAPSTPTTTTGFTYGSRSHHRRLHSRNSSQGSLLIDTSFAAGGGGSSTMGMGSANSGLYSPGPASLTSSASSSRRNSVSSDYGGGVFLRKGGSSSSSSHMVGFRPDESEIMIGNLMDGPNGNEGVQRSSGNGKRSSSSATSKKVKRRTRGSGSMSGGGGGFPPGFAFGSTNTATHGGSGGPGGGRVRDALGRIGVLNDWDMLLPTSDGYDDGEDEDDIEDDEDSGLNADERWKKRQLRKKGWESTRGQAIIVCFLLIVATFVRIWKLAVPAAVVFDEQHFGGFTVDYMRGEFFLDVHPPLGKMLFALVAYLLGFDGNFNFIIGRLYPKNVPFIGLRLFTAMCGVGLVPISYWTIRRAGFSTQAAIICALLVTFENALITQSRFILLDAPMMLFMGYTMLAWISFYNYRNRPFSRGWWLWLVQTGFGLFLSSSVKWVGLFTITTVGCCVLKYLQEVRTQLYLSTLLPNSGSGDSWVSPQFQMTLKNHVVEPVMADIGWESRVHIRHANTNGGWIHSMRGEYARSGTVDQAIQLVEWDDDLTCWQVLPSDPVVIRKHEAYERERRLSSPVLPAFDRLVYHGDEIRLRHCYTKVVMATNDLISIGSNKTFIKEVRGVGWSKEPLEETTWRVELVSDGVIPGLPESSKIMGDREMDGKDKATGSDGQGGESKLSNQDQEKPRSAMRDETQPWHAIKGFRLWNEKHQCYLQSHKVFRSLYSMYQEVGCIQGGRQKANTIFIVDQNINKKLPKNTKSISYEPLSFFQKFIELNKVMWWTHHDLNTPMPPSADGSDDSGASSRRRITESRPWTWPLLKRGLNYYSSKETNNYVYLIGNPILWWSASAAALFYMLSCLWSTIRYIKGTPSTRSAMAERRDRFGLTPFYAIASGTFYAGWAIHFLPFFLIQRQLYLHHYLPALYFSILLLVSRLDRLWQRWPRHLRLASGLGVVALVTMSWYAFSPLAYGTDFGSRARCERLRALGSWDFVCQRTNLPWARPQGPKIVVEKRSEHALHDHDSDGDVVIAAQVEQQSQDESAITEPHGVVDDEPHGDHGGNGEYEHEHHHQGPFEEADRQHYEHEHFKHPPPPAHPASNDVHSWNTQLIAERNQLEAEKIRLDQQLQQLVEENQQLEQQQQKQQQEQQQAGGSGDAAAAAAAAGLLAGRREELQVKIQAVQMQQEHHKKRLEDAERRFAEEERRHQQAGGAEQQQQQQQQQQPPKCDQAQGADCDQHQAQGQKEQLEREERERQETEKQQREEQEQREREERERQERESQQQQQQQHQQVQQNPPELTREQLEEQIRQLQAQLASR
ncbi:hypothetical protein BGZ73_003837 [Actinomortierella ambigua]|nr:hypothetical protein BGZ73_003837 [Actinomortierella ambigua]